jgi:hypothetical protein
MGKSAKDDQHPFQQRSGMICLGQKKDNLDGGNIASGTLGSFVVDVVLYGILFDPLRVIVNVQRFVRESKIFFLNYCIANLHLQSKKLCVWNTKTNRETFAKKTGIARNSTWLPVFAVSSDGNYSFCSCNPLGQSFVYFLS